MTDHPTFMPAIHSSGAPAHAGNRRRRTVGAMLGGALLALGIAAPAFADTVPIEGVLSGPYSTATLVCEFNPQTNTVSFTITNVSAITQPGSTSTITGLGFDLPPTGNASASGLNGFTGSQAPSLSSDFTFADSDVGNVPLFNSAVLDFAFLTGSTFSGGAVNLGLLPGESASFTVSGAAFAGFTESQICNAIFVRFQNVPAAGASDGLDVGIPDAAGPDVVGVSTGNLATADLVCTFNAQTNTFTFTITNTSPFDARITAIGFDLPPAGNASRSGLNGFTGTATFQPAGTEFDFTDAALGRVPLLGDAVLDFGFVTGRNFRGGNPNKGLPPGIDPGDEATFVVSGAAFAGMTEDQICDSIVVRFQRVGQDGSLGDVAVPPPD